MTDELSERTCTRCGRNPLNRVFLVGDERLCFYCKYHKQPAVPSNVDDPETWKGIERSYDAAPPAPTAVQQSYCNICGQGVVDGTLACGHVYTGWLDKTPAPQGGKCFGKHGPAPDTRHAEAQEPKAQDDPTWMDDCINVCSRHSLQFTKHPDECFVCTNRASHTPTVWCSGTNKWRGGRDGR